MRDCTEEVPKDFLEATLEAAGEQAKGTIPWVAAIAADMTTPEATLKDLNLKPFSPSKIKEAQQSEYHTLHASLQDTWDQTEW